MSQLLHFFLAQATIGPWRTGGFNPGSATGSVLLRPTALSPYHNCTQLPDPGPRAGRVSKMHCNDDLVSLILISLQGIAGSPLWPQLVQVIESLLSLLSISLDLLTPGCSCSASSCSSLSRTALGSSLAASVFSALPPEAMTTKRGSKNRIQQYAMASTEEWQLQFVHWTSWPPMRHAY